MGHQSREDLPDLASEHDVSEAIHVRRAGVDDDHASAGGLRRRHAVGGRVDAQCRADGQEEVTLLAGPQRPVDDLRHQRLTEGDGVALQDAPALEARRILLTCPDPLEGVGHRSPVVATPATRPPHRAVDLDHELDVRAGPLVQPVDVLGDDRVQLAPTLELDDRVVPTVRLSLPTGIGSAVAPRLPADVGFGEVVLERRRLLGAGVLGPDTLGAAEVGDARIGGDPCSGEDRDPIGLVDPPTHGVQVGVGRSRRKSCGGFPFRAVRNTHGGTDLLHAPTDPTREVP